MAQKKKPKKSIMKEFIVWGVHLALIVLCIYLITHYVVEKKTVDGDSMAPSLLNKESILVDKISYRFRDPRRFEIVVFPFAYQTDTYYVKRVIGLPGETVQIYDGAIYINGKLLNDPYGKEYIKNAGLASDTITLGQNDFFVMGDNRNDSRDSREPSIGNVVRDKIVGRAFMRLWPLSKLDLL